MAMQEEKESKIVFAIKKIKEGIDVGCCCRYYKHIVGDSINIIDGLRSNRFETDWVDSIKIALEQNKEGKFIVGDFIIYILPSSITTLHTCQYPFIVMKDDEVIDIDEYWYTPFKNMLAESYDCKALSHFDDINSDRFDTSYGYVEEAFAIKCTLKNSKDKSSPLIAIRSQNITFNL